MSEQCDISYQGRPPDMEIYKKTQWYSNGILTDTQGGNVYGTSVIIQHVLIFKSMVIKLTGLRRMYR